MGLECGWDLSQGVEDNESKEDEVLNEDEDDRDPDRVIYPYGIDRVSDRVGYKVALALEKALAKEKEADARIEEILKKLDENEEDELLAIDFRSLKNNFKTLEDNILPKIKFRLPHVWTKQYAPSLKCDRDRMSSSPPPDINQPVFTPIDSSTDLTLDEIGIIKRPFLYISKSLNDMYNILLDDATLDPRTKVKPSKSENFHKTSQRITKRLAGCVSSHYDYGGRGLKYYEKCLVYESVSIDDDCHYATGQIAKQEHIQNAMDRLDSLCTELRIETKSTKLPLITDSQYTPSKNHISIATQVEAPVKSSFEEFVELKRRLAQQREHGGIKESSLKDWSKVTFLKNVSIEEYMRYKSEKKPGSLNGNQTKIVRTAKNAKLTKKDKALSINGPYKQKPKKHQGTLAIAPGHSTKDLKTAKSEDVEDLWQSVQRNAAAQHCETTPVIQYSSAKILPVLNQYNHIITDKMINTGEIKAARIAKSQSIHPHLEDMKRLNRSEHSILRDRCSRNEIKVKDSYFYPDLNANTVSSSMSSHTEQETGPLCAAHLYSALKKDTAANKYRPDITFNHLLKGAQSVITNNAVKNLQSTPSHVVNWPLSERYSKRHFTSPDHTENKMTPRRYLTELVLGLRKYKLGRAPAVFGYHHAEFGREVKPLKMHQMLTDRPIPGKILTHEVRRGYGTKTLYNYDVHKTSSVKRVPSASEPPARSPSLIHMPPDIDWRSIEEDNSNVLKFSYTHKSTAQADNMKELSVSARRWHRAYNSIQHKAYRFT